VTDNPFPVQRGEARLFHLAVCATCRMTMPFYDVDERTEWASEHCSGTGHDVHMLDQYRAIIGGSPRPT